MVITLWGENGLGKGSKNPLKKAKNTVSAWSGVKVYLSSKEYHKLLDYTPKHNRKIDGMRPYAVVLTLVYHNEGKLKKPV